MIRLAFLFVLFPLFPFALLSQNAGLSDYFAQVRTGHYPALPADVLRARRADDLIKELTQYQADTLPHVRRQAADLLRTIGTQSNPARIRSRAVQQLVEALRDKDSGNVGFALGCLQQFRRSDFSDVVQDTLHAFFRRRIPHTSQLIRLMGYVGVSRAREDWFALAGNREANTADRWAALLALSRMGEERAMSEVMSRVRRMPVNDDVVYEIFPDLAYTRRREAVAYLLETLHSDAATCESADPERPVPIPCAYRVMEMLAPVIQDFPLRLGAGGDVETENYAKALEKVRVWFLARSGYKILNDRF
jgi:hypothetical protein